MNKKAKSKIHNDSTKAFTNKCLFCSLKKCIPNFQDEIKKTNYFPIPPKKKLENVYKQLFKLMKHSKIDKIILNSNTFESIIK